jgi:hypothetical protein
MPSIAFSSGAWGAGSRRGVPHQGHGCDDLHDLDHLLPAPELELAPESLQRVGRKQGLRGRIEVGRRGNVQRSRHVAGAVARVQAGLSGEERFRQGGQAASRPGLDGRSSKRIAPG